MTLRGIEHFPDLDEWTEEDIQNNGYRRYSISIFDHWLSREEYCSNPYVSLERARANGLESIFHEQNKRFRSFYHRIFDTGVFRFTGSRLRPQVAWHSCWDRRLKKAVTAMVEDRAWSNEFYAPAWRIRISAADVRTDVVLLEGDADEAAIRRLAASHELHLI